jgi:hypothetical protein
MNAVFSWSSSLIAIWSQPGVAVEEVEQVAARGGIDDLISIHSYPKLSLG